MPTDETLKDTIIDELLKTGTRAMQFGMEQHAAPDLLYHFTSSEGLVGILRSRSLWASHALSLNDASEVSYGIAMTRKYLQGRVRDEQGPLRRVFLESALKWLETTWVSGLHNWSGLRSRSPRSSMNRRSKKL